MAVLLAWFLARQGLFGVSKEIELGPGSDIYPVGNVSIPRHEASGICRSSTPGVFWIHSDSGDEPRIYAIRENGQFVSSPTGIKVEGATNRDWEDIKCVNHTLYLADTGNNLNYRQDQCIYVVPEPAFDAASTRAEKSLPVNLPGRSSAWKHWDLDCEAFFLVGQRFYFLTKERWPFQLDAPRPGTSLFAMNASDLKLDLVARHPDLDGWVTSADLSPDGQTLAVLCEKPIQSVWLFPVVDKVPNLLAPSRRYVFHRAGRAEGICFRDGGSLLVLNEEGFIFLISLESSPFYAVKAVTQAPTPAR